MRKSVFLIIVCLLELLTTSCQKQNPVWVSLPEIIVEHDVPFVTLNTSGSVMSCGIRVADSSGMIYVSAGETSYKYDWFEVTLSDAGRFVRVDLVPNESGQDRMITMAFSQADYFARCTITQKSNN